jgi:hypothetical protein
MFNRAFGQVEVVNILTLMVEKDKPLNHLLVFVLNAKTDILCLSSLLQLSVIQRDLP